VSICFPKLCRRLGHRDPKKIFGPLTLKKSPQVSVFEAASSRRRHDSKSFPEKMILLKT
jgi:hypothetical protein